MLLVLPTPARLYNILGRIAWGAPNQCWLWTGAVRWHRRGRDYGQLIIAGRKWTVSRFVYLYFNGPIPDGLFVRHACDTPRCCNPLHLVVGTHDENMADKVARGRQAKGLTHGRHTKPEATARGDTNGSRRHPERLRRGETVHGAILTEGRVASIRRLLASNHGLSLADIAGLYGVSTSTIYAVKSGRIWKHVSGPRASRAR